MNFLKSSVSGLANDAIASVVVFLVALPLCMGIAILSGLPPALGLATGIIGGLVVGSISGSPLQISGPTAGLAVIVFEAVREFGVAGMGLIFVAAGVLQFFAGRWKLGQWFRAISPAVVYGVLAGIGIRKLGPANSHPTWRICDMNDSEGKRSESIKKTAETFSGCEPASSSATSPPMLWPTITAGGKFRVVLSYGISSANSASVYSRSGTSLAPCPQRSTPARDKTGSGASAVASENCAHMPTHGLE